VLFIDARHTYRQIDRAHRDFTPEQHEFLANIVRLFRGEEPEFTSGSQDMVEEQFPSLTYQDVSGLCCVARVDEIAGHGWSLSPARYVGVADRSDDGFEFSERFGELSEEFQALTIEAEVSQNRVFQVSAEILKQ
jgi:type I restriction enzyme M protein